MIPVVIPAIQVDSVLNIFYLVSCATSEYKCLPYAITGCLNCSLDGTTCSICADDYVLSLD